MDVPSSGANIFAQTNLQYSKKERKNGKAIPMQRRITKEDIIDKLSVILIFRLIHSSRLSEKGQAELGTNSIFPFYDHFKVKLSNK